MKDHSFAPAAHRHMNHNRAPKMPTITPRTEVKIKTRLVSVDFFSAGNHRAVTAGLLLGCLALASSCLVDSAPAAVVIPAMRPWQDSSQNPDAAQPQVEAQPGTESESQEPDASPDAAETPKPTKPEPQEAEDPPAESEDGGEGNDSRQEDESGQEDESRQEDENGDSDDESQSDDPEQTPDQQARQSERRTRTARFLQFAKFNEQMKDLLKDQIGSAASSTVQVFVDNDEMPSAMGMIIDSKGFAMTKASMLTGAVRCRLANGRMVPAIVYGVDIGTDLALLRLQATNLSAVQWSPQSEQDAKEGYWVLSPNAQGELMSVGVVSVAARQIPPVSGFIGIMMSPGKDGVEITTVVRGSAAEKFGLKVNDVITTVDETEVKTPGDMSTYLRNKRPGDVVALSVLRDSTKLALRVVLGNREEDNPDNERSNNQNTMSGEISQRRDDFPMAFQHDSVLSPEDCGGPITDLDGRVIGMNIARSGRVKSYALPMSLVESVFQRLSSGQFSPEVVYADRLEGYQTVLLSVATEAVRLTAQIAEFEKEYSDQGKVVQEAKNSITEIEKQMEDLKSQLAKKQQALEAEETRQAAIQSKVRSKERELEKANAHKKELEKERKELLFGAN